MRLTDRTDVVLGIMSARRAPSASCSMPLASYAASTGSTTFSPRPQWIEQDPHAWWAALVSAVRQAIREAEMTAGRARHRRHRPDARRGAHRQTGPLAAIIWMDRRSASCAAILKRPPDVVLRKRAIACRRATPGPAPPGYARSSRKRSTGRGPSSSPKTSLCCASPVRSAASRRARRNLRHPPAPLVGDAGERLRLHPGAADSPGFDDGRRRAASPPLDLGCARIFRSSPGRATGLLLLGTGVVEPGRGSITVGTGGQMTVVSTLC